MSDPYRRKRDHLALTHTGDVGHGQHRGLFEDVALVHDCLPELSMDALDLDTPFLDHRLSAPLMVTGMTGGPPEAGEINRTLSRLCGELGLAFGVGSQRVTTREAAALDTFIVRDGAPDVVLLGNIGVNQARDLGPRRVRALMDGIGADYMAVHLNPAMELVQPGADADHDFRGGYDTIGRLVDALSGRVVVKECGSGVAPRAVRRLHGLGVRAVDVSGSGGTSWVKVEALRAQGPRGRLGHTFADWGIPTAAAVALGAGIGPLIIASGGVDGGLTAAKALALGAGVAGFARPVLQALLDGGEDGARDFLTDAIAALRTAMVLTGCRTPAELAGVPKVIGPRLGAWIEQVEPAP